MAHNKNKSSLGILLKGRENYFDLIRLFAALLVLFSHAYPLSGNDNEPLLVLSNGQVTFGNLAVYIFFIISGLLITQSYFYSSSLITFLKSRILRIFPGLLGVLLFSAFIIGPLFTTLSLKDYLQDPTTLDYLKAVFLFPMYWNLPGVFETNIYADSVNGSLWTIPFEFLCYLIIGCLGFFKLLKHRYLMLFITICTFYYFMFNKTISPVGGRLFELELNTLVELSLFFFMGSLLFLFRDSLYLKKEIVMIGIVILFLSLFYGGFKPLFAVIAPYSIMYLAFLPKTRLQSISKYGDLSYGVYLYAFPIQQIVAHLFGGSTSPWINFLISVPVVLMLAFLSWHIIEKNFMKLKKVNLTKLLSPCAKWDFGKVSTLIDGISDHTERIVARILKLNWSGFLVIFTAFIFLFSFYNSKPSVIEFPYLKSESIFHDGWLPQSSNENYRWIAQRAGVELSFPSKEATIQIEGFIPESFKEVNHVVLYVDNNMIHELDVKNGESIIIRAPFNGKGQTHLVTLEFNATHKPSQDEADQREMSALISKIVID